MGAWSVFGKSQVFTPTILGIGNFKLASPISVKKGDDVGVFFLALGGISMTRYSNSEPWSAPANDPSVLFMEGKVGQILRNHPIICTR